MMISEIIDLSKSGDLTCSKVAELFYSQPYTQDPDKQPPDSSGKQADYAIPHAHVHMRDGFQLPKAPPPSAESVMLSNLHKSKFAATKKFWEEMDSQLFEKPSGVGLYDGKYDNEGKPDPKQKDKLEEYEKSKKLKADKFAEAEGLEGSPNFRMMDSRMADKTNEYNRRTGWPNTPAVGLIYKCKIPQSMARPILVPVPDQLHPYDVDPWKGSVYKAAIDKLVATDDGQCIYQGSKVINVGQIKPNYIVYEKDAATYKPPVSKSNPHSMFEDSESAIVSLTAVLLSEAGRKVLEALIAGTGLDRSVSLAVQSRTSVAVLQAQMKKTPDLWKSQHIKRVNEAIKKGEVPPPPLGPSSDHDRRGHTVKLIDRVQDLNSSRALAGTFSTSSKDIAITNSTFSNYPAGHLMLVSHYPSAIDIADLAADKDRYEIMQTVFADVDMPKVLPVLKW